MLLPESDHVAPTMKAARAAESALPRDFENWHPKLQRLFRYWESICPAQTLPGRQHFDPLAVADLLPGIWLLDVQPEPFRLRYRLVGTRIVEAIGQETTGLWMDEAHPHLLAHKHYFDRYQEVVGTRIPSRRRGPARMWTHHDYREIENVILPLASDGTTVDVLLVMTVMYRLDGTSF